MASQTAVHVLFWDKWQWGGQGPLLWSFEDWDAFARAWGAGGSTSRGRKNALVGARRMSVAGVPYLWGIDKAIQAPDEAARQDLSRAVSRACDEVLLAFDDCTKNGILATSDCPLPEIFLGKACLSQVEELIKDLKEQGTADAPGFFTGVSHAMPLYLRVMNGDVHGAAFTSLDTLAKIHAYLLKELLAELEQAKRSINRKRKVKAVVAHGECKACSSVADLPRFAICAKCMPGILKELKERKVDASDEVPAVIIDLICLVGVKQKVVEHAHKRKP